MSVNLYVSNIVKNIEAKRQSIIKDIDLSAYPTAEMEKALTEAGPKSALASRYTKTGVITPAKVLSADQEKEITNTLLKYPGLDKKLLKFKDADKLKSALTNINAIDPAKLILDDVDGFIKWLKPNDVPFTFSINTEDSRFVKQLSDFRKTVPLVNSSIKYDELMLSLLKSDPATIKAAYTEIYESKYREKFSSSTGINQNQILFAGQEPVKVENQINLPGSSPAKLNEVPSPINPKPSTEVKSEPTNNVVAPAVTSKSETIQSEVKEPVKVESSPINVNLETTPVFAGDAPVSAVANSQTINTTNNTSNTTTSSIFNKLKDNVINKSKELLPTLKNEALDYLGVGANKVKPVINSENKEITKKSIFNKLKDNVINKSKELLPTLKNEALDYLGVGANKVKPVINPIVKAYSAIDGKLEERKEKESSTGATVKTAPQTIDKSIASTNVSTSNNTITVDSKQPQYAGSFEPGKPVVSNTTNENTSVAKTSNDTKNIENTNTVTYGEAKTLGSPAKQQVASTTNQSTENNSSQMMNVDFTELVNEMRSIKMILLGGLDINNKT